MDYIEANLASDEKVIAKIEHSWAGIVPAILSSFFPFIGGLILIILNLLLIGSNLIYYVLGIALVILAAFRLTARIVEIANAQLVVTDKRLFGRRGFIRKQTTDIMLNKIDTINAGNSLFGAIFRYGYIQLVSAASGTNKATLKFNYISNTMEFRKAVLEAIEQAKIKEREEQVKLMRESVQVEAEKEKASNVAEDNKPNET